MSSKPIIPISPIDFDVAKRAVKDFAVERNVPTQVYPHRQAESQPAQGKGAAPAVIEPLKPTRAPGRKFTVVLPEYVIDAINERTMQSKPKKTSRYVVLEALKSLGINIHDEDMVFDGRRSECR